MPSGVVFVSSTTSICAMLYPYLVRENFYFLNVFKRTHPTTNIHTRRNESVTGQSIVIHEAKPKDE